MAKSGKIQIREWYERRKVLGGIGEKNNVGNVEERRPRSMCGRSV